MMKAIASAALVVFLSACAAPAETATVDAGNRAAGAELPIGETGGMCGGIAGFQCASPRDYCEMPAEICVEVMDAAGVCTPMPEICTMEYKPVCGCDGATYPSACSAAGKGVSVASEGECPKAE